MKKCFSTLACIDASLDMVLEYARKASIAGIEIRLDKSDGICGLGISDADIIRSKVRTAGCVITDLASSVSVKDKSEKAVEMAKRCIDLAAAVGALGVRIFVGGHIKTFDDTPEQDLVGAAESVAEMCAYAKPLGVEIWAETHSSLSTAKALCEFCDKVKADNLKILWDVLHSIEYSEPMEESLQLIGDRLAHIHIKDATAPEDSKLTQYRHTALGRGTFPLPGLLKLLEKENYRGYISLEYELPWRPELNGSYADTNGILAAYNEWFENSR